MDMIETRNAIIKRAYLGMEDHGFLTVWLDLDYGGPGQSFGGYNLGQKLDTKNYAGVFIGKVLKCADVEDWNKLPGKTIRVRTTSGKVISIGHIVKDIWFTPAEEFK